MNLRKSFAPPHSCPISIKQITNNIDQVSNLLAAAYHVNAAIGWSRDLMFGLRYVKPDRAERFHSMRSTTRNSLMLLRYAHMCEELYTMLIMCFCDFVADATVVDQ